MSEQYDPFFPQNVDESVEQFTSINQADSALHGPMLTNQEAQLIANLQKFHRPEHERYQQALQRVENRLVERYIFQGKHSSSTPVAPVQQGQPSNRWKIQKGRFNKMQYKQSLSSTPAKLGRSLALVAVVLVLLGSVVAVLNHAHQRTTGNGNTSGIPVKAKPTATPIPKKPIGTTLYTTPSNTLGFEGFSWSPDSKRVADATITNVQIWDAATGKHKVTIQMPGGTSEWPWSLDWSHSSQQVAIATNQHVLIVNGQTGHILRSYASNTSTIGAIPNTSAIAGRSYLTSQMPASGGFGYRATAWSPDSHFMASALSFGINGEIQVWNPQTGTLSFTLNVSNNTYNFGALSWSSDGQYIAASAWNTQGVDPTQPNNMIVVWNVSTHQIVFQHQDSMSSSTAPVVWQSHTHNITYGGNITSGGNMIIALKTWNITTGRQIKQDIGVGTGGLAYSPDGKYLAYSGYIEGKPISAVIIMDVATGKQVYAYKSLKKKNNTSLVAWSPDGKYIVSDESNTQINQGIQESAVAHVWIAE
jgi:WD40 repeat protein